jgi:hypothetical protein
MKYKNMWLMLSYDRIPQNTQETEIDFLHLVLYNTDI